MIFYLLGLSSKVGGVAVKRLFLTSSLTRDLEFNVNLIKDLKFTVNLNREVHF